MNRIVKQLTLVLLLSAATPLWAQDEYVVRETDGLKQGILPCWWEASLMSAPYYYCDCKENAIDFQFGLDMVISDTTWFKASVDQLKQGLSAYWFANSSVTIDVFALCNSSAPSFTVTVGANSMQEKDVTDINKKIDEMGGAAEALMQMVTPRMRVYPNKEGGSGRVICYPYDEGPHSTCEDPLQIFSGMTYVSNHEDEVYYLAPGTNVTNNMFVQWKQAKNQPCEMYITSGTCDGPEVARTTFHDSLKVYFPGKELLDAFRAEKTPLYFHFEHKAEDVGRIMFRSSAKFVTDTVAEAVCRGKGLVLADTTLREPTQYNDTTWVIKDTLLATHYDVTIVEPVQVEEKIGITTKQFPYLYRNTKLIDEFGDYSVLIQTPGQCEEMYLLHLFHQPVYHNTAVEEDICQGKTYTMSNGTVITRDTAIVDSVWHDVDTCVVTAMTIHFTEPELETIIEYLTEEELQNFYFNGKPYYKYGEYDIVDAYPNTCTRHFLLVLREPTPQTGLSITESDNAPYARKVLLDGIFYIEKDGMLYTILGN